MRTRDLMTAVTLRRTLALLLLASLTLSACVRRTGDDALSAGGVEGPREGEPEETVVELDTMLIHVVRDPDGQTRSFAAGLRDLFHEANDYFTAGDYAQAIELYELVLERHEDPAWQRMILYNLGLAYEQSGDFVVASERYGQVVDRWPASRDAADALLRLAECQTQLGQAQRIGPLMRRLLQRTDLGHEQRMEAHLRWGASLMELRRFAEAELQYRELLERNQRATEPLPPHHTVIAQALHSLGAIYHELFSEIGMVLPLERYQRDLRDKQRLFEQAREGYLDAIRSGNRYWSPAGGYMLGRLYEDYYLDILASEVPDSFSELEQELYFEELRAFIEPAMERALTMYEQSLALAYRINSSDEWVEQLLEAVYRVREYMGNRERWPEEHELILQNQHPRSARRSDGLVFRSELER